MADRTAIFRDYEAEFLQHSTPLSGRINTLLSQPDAAESVTQLKAAEQGLAAAQKTLRYMDLEAKGLPEPFKSQLGAKVKTYQESLARESADFKRAQEKVQRAALIGSGRADASGRPLEFGKSAEARSRMEESTSKLQASSAVLDDAHARLEETIGVGALAMLWRRYQARAMVGSWSASPCATVPSSCTGSDGHDGRAGPQP